MTSPLRVFLCGEGANELGSRSGHPSFQSDKHPGVIQALLHRIQPEGWIVVGAIDWKRLPKLRAHGPSPRESDQVARLMLMAEDDFGAAVVAYTRDGDDETKARREAHERGVAKGAELSPSLCVVGEIAAPTIEGWILAALGAHRTEEMSAPKASAELVRAGIGAKSTAEMVQVVETCDLDEVPEDARGLRRWCEAARGALEAEGDRP